MTLDNWHPTHRTMKFRADRTVSIGLVKLSRERCRFLEGWFAQGLGLPARLGRFVGIRLEPWVYRAGSRCFLTHRFHVCTEFFYWLLKIRKEAALHPKSLLKCLSIYRSPRQSSARAYFDSEDCLEMVEERLCYLAFKIVPAINLLGLPRIDHGMQLKDKIVWRYRVKCHAWSRASGRFSTGGLHSPNCPSLG